jgi:hypothetical protein
MQQSLAFSLLSSLVVLLSLFGNRPLTSHQALTAFGWAAIPQSRLHAVFPFKVAIFLLVRLGKKRQWRF